MTECVHMSKVKLTGNGGKTKTFCSDCLWELRAELAPEASGGANEPYTSDTVQLLKAGNLSIWETEFIDSIGKMRNGLTAKQQSVWNGLVRKYFPRGAAAKKEPPLDIPFGVSGEDAPF